jgi:hypothetical protein
MEEMRVTIRAVVWGVALGVVLSAVGGLAQNKGCIYQDENGKTVNSPDCTVPPDPQPATQPGAPASSTPAPASAPQSTPSAAKQFPFPGEPASATPNSATPAIPAANPDQPATKRFPFPGEPAAGSGSGSDGQKPVTPAGGGLQDAGSSGSSSDAGSSSSSSSSADHNDPTAGPLGDEDDDAAAKAVAARKNRKKLPPVARQTPTEQEQEDLNVAQFYQDKGSYKAAYLRATDAVTLAVDDPDAHFALAEAARRLGKLDEAETHYKKCLTLDPIPKEKKAAQDALKQMAGK